MRPIDADALSQNVIALGKTGDSYDPEVLNFRIGYNSALLAVKKLIANAPTLDAAPVRRDGCEYCRGSQRMPYQETHVAKLFINTFGEARTIEVETNRCPPFANCSMVNVPARSAFVINFCPNCGADMRGETHGTD